jgi:hypothetical protein
MSTTESTPTTADEIDLTDDDPSGSDDRVVDVVDADDVDEVDEVDEVEPPITPDEVEEQLRETVEVAEQAVQDNKGKLVVGGIAGIVAFILLVFLYGRRRGKKQATTIELVEI